MCCEQGLNHDSACSFPLPQGCRGYIFAHVFVCILVSRMFVVQGLCNSRVRCAVFVRPSVCPVDRQQLQLAAGLVLSILQAEDRLLIDSYGRRVPAIDRYLLPAQEQQMRVSSL